MTSLNTVHPEHNSSLSSLKSLNTVRPEHKKGG